MPYESLSTLGITRDLADNLPPAFKQQLLSGQITPIIVAKVNYDNGTSVSAPLKLQLVSDSNGQSCLIAYPVKRDIDNSLNLSAHEIDRLRQGEIILKPLDDNGNTRLNYIQLDPDTKSLIVMERSTMERKLAEFEKIKDIELGSDQRQAIREGKPVILNVGNEPVVVSADLREPQSFRMLNGDMKQWETKMKMEYDEAHPEFLGLVQTDKNRWEYQQVMLKDMGQKTDITIERSSSLKR